MSLVQINALRRARARIIAFAPADITFTRVTRVATGKGGHRLDTAPHGPDTCRVFVARPGGARKVTTLAGTREVIPTHGLLAPDTCDLVVSANTDERFTHPNYIGTFTVLSATPVNYEGTLLGWQCDLELVS